MQSVVKSEEVNCVFIADVIYNLSGSFYIVRIFAVFYERADIVTKNSSEIIVTCVRKKTA